MLFVPEDLAYTIRWRAPNRPDAGPTIEVRGGSGNEIVAAGTAATLSTVSTTLDAQAEAGELSVLVDSTSGITVGDEYLLGPNQDGQSEWIVVAGVSGSYVAVASELRYQHDVNTPLRGTYISYALTATHTATRRRDSRAIFTWAVSTVAQAPGIVRFDIVRHWVGHQPCTTNDVRLHDQLFVERLPPGYDIDRGLDRALQEVLRDLNGARRIGNALADDDWRDIVAMKFLAEYVGGGLGERGKAYRERWVKRYEERVEILESQTIVDEDQSGAISSTEEGVYGGRALRG